MLTDMSDDLMGVNTSIHVFHQNWDETPFNATTLQGD